MDDVWEIIAQQHRAGTDCVVVTTLDVRGSVPGRRGAKAVVTADGLLAGTLGGGRVEARAIETARNLLAADGEACVEHCWNLQRDVGMTCGGEMRFLFETVRAQPAWHVVIFGAGHVARALVGVLGRLACRVDVVDTRREWLEQLPEAPNVTRRLVEDCAAGVEWVGPQSFIVSLTKGHATDRPVLREVLRRHSDIPFLGVIGSAAKRAVLCRELREDGVDPALLEKLVCPVGLPVGSNDPEEIAISIAAQLLERRGC